MARKRWRSWVQGWRSVQSGMGGSKGQRVMRGGGLVAHVGVDFREGVGGLAGEDLFEEVEGGGVDEGVGGEERVAFEGVGAAVHIGDFATGFFDEEFTGGHVPGAELEFPEAIEAAAGDVGQIDGGGAGAADAVGDHGELVVEVDVDIEVAALGGEAGAEEGVFDGFGLGDADGLAVQEGAGAAFGGEHFVAGAVVDDSGDEFTVFFEGQGGVVDGVAVGEVGGAVEGVDVPAVAGGAGGVVAFFSNDGMVGVGGAEAGGDVEFGGAVGEGDEVGFAFELKADALAAEIADDGVGFAGDGGGGFNKIGHELSRFFPEV
jgi:hypothetical protein